MKNKKFVVIAKLVSSVGIPTNELNLPIEAEFELPAYLVVHRYEFECPACNKPHVGEHVERFAPDGPDASYWCEEGKTDLLVFVDAGLEGGAR